MIEISIIIVNWNSGSHLKTCIDSIFKSTLFIFDFQVIIVDNNSTDNSLSIIKENENIHIIRNKKNIGFGAACNIGFKQSNAKYKLLLNPDTKLFSDTIKNSIEFMDKNSQISVLGVKHIGFNGNTAISCSRFPKVRNFLFDIFGLSKYFPNIFHSATLMLDWDHENSAYVDQVMGAYMFMRSTILETTGYMDDNFFVYFEDMDLSYRINKVGGKIFYNSEIKIIHYGGGTSEAVKDYRLFYSVKSRLKYSKKHFNVFDTIILYIASLIFEPLTRIIFLIIKFKIKEIKGLLNGYKLLYSSFFEKSNSGKN